MVHGRQFAGMIGVIAGKGLDGGGGAGCQLCLWAWESLGASMEACLCWSVLQQRDVVVGGCSTRVGLCSHSAHPRLQ